MGQHVLQGKFAWKRYYVGIPYNSIFSANGIRWLKNKDTINEGVLGECGGILVIKFMNRI